MEMTSEDLVNSYESDNSLYASFGSTENLTFVNTTDVLDDELEENVNDILNLCEIIETSVQQYIHNTQLKCSTTMDISCGLNPMKHFEPVVKIQNTVNEANITFSYFEWESLIFKMDLLFQQFLNNNDANENCHLPVFGNMQLHGIVSNINGKYLQICKNGFDDFQLSREDVSKILEITYIVSSNIDLLKDLNFSQYYFKVLVIVNDIMKLYDNVNPLYLLTSFCNLSLNSIHSYCFRECLFFYKDKVLHDLEACNI